MSYKAAGISSAGISSRKILLLHGGQIQHARSPVLWFHWCFHKRTVANNLRTGNTRQATLSLEDIKVTKILFATVVGFIICWTPVLVIDIVDGFLGAEWELTRGTYYMYTIFGITSSTINPVYMAS